MESSLSTRSDSTSSCRCTPEHISGRTQSFVERATRFVRSPLATLSGLHFLNDGLQAGLLLCLSLAAANYGLSAAGLGLVTSLHFGLGILLAIPVGLFSRKGFGRRMLIGGLWVTSLGYCLLGQVQGSLLVLVVFFIGSLGFASFHPIAFSLVAHFSGRRSTGSAMGTFAAAGDLGRAVISTMVLGLCAAVATWQTVTTGIGMLCCVIAVMMTMCFARSPHFLQPPKEESTSASRRQTVRLWKHPRFLIACGFGVFDALANSALYVFLPIILFDKGFTSTQVTAMVSVFFWSSLLGKAMVGRLADRWSQLSVLGFCHAGLAASFLALCLTHQVVAVIAILSLVGVLSKGTLPVIMSWTAAMLPRSAYDQGFGMNQAVLGAATTIAPLLLGGSTMLLGPAGSCYLTGAICAVSCISALVVGRVLTTTVVNPS